MHARPMHPPCTPHARPMHAPCTPHARTGLRLAHRGSRHHVSPPPGAGGGRPLCPAGDQLAPRPTAVRLLPLPLLPYTRALLPGHRAGATAP
eukprot:scaffold24397_cov52-Phaeocystis_antarctica.AAC.2